VRKKIVPVVPIVQAVQIIEGRKFGEGGLAATSVLSECEGTGATQNSQSKSADSELSVFASWRVICRFIFLRALRCLRPTSVPEAFE
jgi:hypothetical protein